MKTPKPPTHFSEEARKLWRSLNEEYQFTPDTLAILRVSLENYDLSQEAREALKRDGLVLDGKRHPAVDIARQSYGLFLRGMRQLALDVVGPGPTGRPPGR